jgi:molecular chaperone HtpG
MAKKRKFKTEVQHLLDLMIHSLYSNKDIFLREIIANAADAIDKARFKSLRDDSLSREWAIRVEIDKEEKCIRITDNGIGMTEDEVANNIGTIAKSGTKAFMQAIEESKASAADLPELIGQFGVGFYSSFMVADKVELISKRAGSDEPAVKWTSTGESGYTLDSVEKEDQGTVVSIFLKEDADMYLETWKLREIIRKYSDYIEYPIIMPITKKVEEKDVTEDETVNSQKAIWLRNPSEITEEDHEQFFSHLSHFQGKPLRHMTFSAEGVTEFKALLYLPEKSPFNVFMPDHQKKGLQLYVKRVFITDECEQLIPDYMRFVKGIVDSSDLPLNVSREILQENPLLAQIRKNIVRKVLSELKKLRENETETYVSFFKEFGAMIKEGIHTDFENREKLEKLAMYETMNGKPGEMIGLDDYITAMPESQEHIYYLTGESRAVLDNSPALEYFKAKGWDVVYMTEPIDEWVIQSMQQFDQKYLKSAVKGQLEDKDSEEKVKEATEKHKSLIEFLGTSLEEKVKEVRFTNRLTESACCLVGDETDMGAHMERLMKAMNQDVPAQKKILELNADHPLVGAFQSLFDKSPDSEQLPEFANMLYDQALLTSGGSIPDPLNFAKRIANLMVTGMQK